MLSKIKKQDSDLVIFGDSLSTDFFVSKTIPTMIRARLSANKGGWQKYLNLQTNAYSTVSGYVSPDPASLRFRSKMILGAKSLEEIVLQYCEQWKKHPKAYFIWIGHNNLDWKADTDILAANPKDHIQQYPQELVQNKIQVLEHMAMTLPVPDIKTPIIVSGLVNFKDFFKLRNKELNESNNFKNSHMSELIFPSIKKEYQENLVEMCSNYNQNLAKQIENKKSLFSQLNYDLEYCDIFPKIPINNPKILNQSDAWHLSEFGKEYFAKNIDSYLNEKLSC